MNTFKDRARGQLDPFRPHAFFLESERAESGEIVSVATIFLTNRECPWQCVYCDLWKNTLTQTVPVGAIPAQIDYALALRDTAADFTRPRPSFSSANVHGFFEHEDEDDGRGRFAKQIKLYNSGSFFDPRAIPPEDYPG